MARVTTEEVKDIFDTTMDEIKIQAFINTANLLVTNVVANATASPAMSSDELKEVERWLAAHFCSVRDPVSLRSRIGDAESWNFPASVTTAWGKGLNLTPYGQMAQVVDRTGSLASMGLRQASYRAAPRENSGDYNSDDTTTT